jgi:threonine dehydratase
MTDVRAAADRIESYTHRTPVFTSRYLDARTGSTVFLKAENLQKVGAFKARGATNAILSLSEDDAARGVVTHSSGNHGQAVAYACSLRNIAAIVVMPEHAPEVKIEAVRGYGASVMFSKQAERAQTVSRLIDEHGYTEVHPFDDAAVIAGQATATLELVDEVDDLDLVLAPIGGGGLLSGASIVATEYKMDVIGAEPEVVDDSYRSLRDGVRYPATGAISVGDGLLVGIGVIPFAILSRANRSVVTVTEDEIIEAMGTLAQRTKLVVEPSGATAVAALISHAPLFAGKRVGVILSGGNV